MFKLFKKKAIKPENGPVASVENNTIPLVEDDITISKEPNQVQIDDFFDGLTLNQLRQAIQCKGDEIISSLELNKKSSATGQLFDKNHPLYLDPELYKIFKIFKYIILNADYDDELVEIKRTMSVKTLEEAVIKDVYSCLCKGKTVCTGDACAMVYLLNKIGKEARHITIAPSKDDRYNYHEVVVFKYNGENRICDPTLIRSALKNKVIDGIKIGYMNYTPETYFAEIRPDWQIVGAYRNIEIDFPEETEKE